MYGTGGNLGSEGKTAGTQRLIFIKYDYLQGVFLLLGDKFLKNIPRNTKMLKYSMVPHWF